MRYAPVVLLAFLVGFAGWSLATHGGRTDLRPVKAEVAGAAVTATRASGGLLPATLAGMDLSTRLTGDAARAEVEQLHGKVLGAGLDQAWVGQYGAAGEATVWVTRSVRAQDAQDLLARMAARIAEGRSPFRVVGPLSIDGVQGYELDGMGQKHYYFLLGTDLYWLAVAPAEADVALAELVTQGTAAAGR